MALNWIFVIFAGIALIALIFSPIFLINYFGKKRQRVYFLKLKEDYGFRIILPERGFFVQVFPFADGTIEGKRVSVYASQLSSRMGYGNTAGVNRKSNIIKVVASVKKDELAIFAVSSRKKITENADERDFESYFRATASSKSGKELKLPRQLKQEIIKYAQGEVKKRVYIKMASRVGMLFQIIIDGRLSNKKEYRAVKHAIESMGNLVAAFEKWEI